MYPSPASLLEVKRLSSAETGITLLGISHLELRLLDHYCNFVAPIISAHDHLRRMWQYEIPHQAKTHSFLMHNILSTSAYHLCCAYGRPLQWQQEISQYVSPVNGESTLIPPFYRISPGHIKWQIRQSNRYERFALEQQRLAFKTYIPSLCALTSHNQEALCAASALLSLNSLASTQNHYCLPARQSQHSSPIDDWLEISVLVRGVNAVVQNAGTSIMDGALQPMLRLRRVEPSSDGTESDVESQVRRLVSPRVLSALDYLAPAIAHCTSSEADKEILHAALGLLKTSFAIVAVNPEHDSIVMVWSNLLDVQFFPFVKRREPMALILLAYWTVLFGTFRNRWWVGGLGITILRHIAEFLTPLDKRNEEVSDEHVKEEDRALIYGRLERYPDAANDPTAGKAKWRDLLEWPLRECGIHDL
ncbi:MAG: hypothetical protein Q9161_001742 [Pseudevernia consocians]